MMSSLSKHGSCHRSLLFATWIALIPLTSQASQSPEISVMETRVISQSGDEPTVTAVERLKTHLELFNAYEANFSQVRYSVSRELLDISSGRFVLKRPNQFIWQTYEPFEQKIVSDGESLWTIDTDLEQVIINDLDENVENAPIFLLAREQVEVENLFQVKYERDADQVEIFNLTPKDESGSFERVRLVFDKQRLLTLELYDSLGQLTRVSMTNIRLNPILDAAQFEHQPEPDFDIIDTRKQPNSE